MSSTFAREIARLAATLVLLAGMSGCKFEPGGLTPGEETGEDSGPPEDGTPLPVDSGPGMDSTVTLDSGPELDAMPPIPPDARRSPQRRKQITILESRVEAPAAPGVLTDFPVLFSVVDADIAALASADGSDIYFIGADGVVRLEYEIEKWVKNTGELVAWVRIPVLSSVVNTVFYVAYGDPALAPPANPRDAWSSDFAAVWHLSQNPGPGMTGEIKDSTTGNDGTAQSSMQSADLVTGQIGDAIDFDGLDDEITFANPLSGDTPHTISAWVLQDNTSSSDALVVLGNGAFNQARFLHSAHAQGNVTAGFYSNDHPTSLDISDSQWRLLHWTFDGNRSSRLYVNGAPVGGPVMVMAGVDTQGSDGRIGDALEPAFGTNMNLNGRVDEVRISTTVRPPEWIETEYNNQSSPSTFYTVGPETAE